MNRSHSTRREFLAHTGSIATGSWLTMSVPLLMAAAQTACSKREQNAGFTNLEAFDALDLESITEQILPSGDTPGAKEAGVIWFIDEALGNLLKEWGWAAPLMAGLSELNASLAPGLRFAELPWAEQAEVLKANESTPFFDKIHFLTVAGMFAMPSYGGNRDKLGWALIGFQDRHNWQPPFGYYDKDYAGGDSA